MYAIDSAEKIEYKDNAYYLRIRTCDTNNPVVLFLHGGCGSPDRAHVMKYQSPLADRFTLVAWDQRGAGFAYDKNEAENLVLTKEIYVEDAHNVVCYLKNRFNKDKIIVVGHSFGSALGVWLAHEYPDDIEAYVGIGQCVDYVQNEMLSYGWALSEAMRIKDKKSVKKLQKIGFPENGKYAFNHQKSLMKQRAVLHKLGGATYLNRRPYWQELLFHELPILKTEYKLPQLIKYLKGLNYSPNQPIARTNPDLINTVKSLDVPIYLLLGRHDYNCVCTLAKDWFNSLSAPKKQLIWFENSAHSPHWEEPLLWNDRFAKLFKHNL
ncbi:MAG: alpha/beta hydrolase [Bacteroides sp.]|nr:alpha/beta hydrolase [Bacillota bacterium]MCM1393555.1 alpha/beta hydrolase [[Eubacterium] siraeum]MCM1455359.1 alpha/beta hydrolase [Bacteroides sp.]